MKANGTGERRVKKVSSRNGEKNVMKKLKRKSRKKDLKLSV